MPSLRPEHKTIVKLCAPARQAEWKEKVVPFLTAELGQIVKYRENLPRDMRCQRRITDKYTNDVRVTRKYAQEMIDRNEFKDACPFIKTAAADQENFRQAIRNCP